MEWYSWLSPHFKYLIDYHRSMDGIHALMINTIPGMGDEVLLYAVSRFIMCQYPKKYKSCGSCRGCSLMLAGNHPDYYVLSPENSKNMLGIDSVRKMREKLHEHAWLKGAKIVRLINANLLTEEAASALLKTVEELSEQTWLFSSCFEPRFLSSTLRSRFLVYHLSVPEESWSHSWLSSKVSASRERIITAIRLCGGAPVAALAMLESSSIYTQREILHKLIMEAIKSNNWLVLMEILDDNQVKDRLHWLISLLSDALKKRYDTMVIVNVDNENLVNLLAYRFSEKFLWNFLNNINECYKQIATINGINQELVLTNCLLNLEGYL